MSRRTVIAAAGWLAAALVATLLGVAAIGLAGESITGTPGGILDDEQVAAALASPYTLPPASSATAPPPSAASSAAAPRTFAVPGGSAVAECVAGEAHLITWTPAQGYSVTDVDRGPDDDAEVEFDGPGGRSGIHVRCQDGTPIQDRSPDDD